MTCSIFLSAREQEGGLHLHLLGFLTAESGRQARGGVSEFQQVAC